MGLISNLHGLARCGFLARLAAVALCASLWMPAAFADPADPADPRVQALAATLGSSPAQIHSYLRDQVGIDIYAGSLRGARGVLAGMSGNALDRASLAIALLRAAGFSARYAQGTLAANDTRTLVARSLANPLRVLGCFNPLPIRDVIGDFTLDTEAQTHYWVEYAPTGAGPFTAMDPSFEGAALGQTFAAVVQTFTSIPAPLRHKVRLRVDAETFTQAAAAFGLGLGSTTVLDQTFETAELVDHPLTVGHFVNSFAPPALALGAITNTYSPYLLVGDSTASPLDYQVIRGSDYTEIITNFPQGNVLVTGIFLNIDVTDSAGQVTSSQRTLADRIGYAARQSGGPVNVDQGSLARPLLTELDLYTLGIQGARQPLDDFTIRRTRLESLQGQLAAIQSAVQALPPWNQHTPAQRTLALSAISLSRATSIAVNEMLAATFAGAADAASDRNADRLLVKAYFNAPRITIAATRASATALSWSLDVHRNAQRVVEKPGISFRNAQNFGRVAGISESILEGEVLSQVTGEIAISIAAILQNTTDPLSIVPVTPENPDLADDLSLSPEAKARIRAAVRAGRAVLAPRGPVMVGGKAVTGWLETDPNTGYTISTFEDGTHGALVEYGFTLLSSVTADPVANQLGGFIGRVNAVGVFGVAFMSAVLQTIASGDPFGSVYGNLQATLAPILKGILKQVFAAIDDLGVLNVAIKGRTSIVVLMVRGLKDGLQDLAKAFNAAGGDPPSPTTLFALPEPPLPAPQPPGMIPGVSVSLALDPVYTVDAFGAEFQSVYLAHITNTGPVADDFFVSPSGGGLGLNMLIPKPYLRIPAGATAEIHVCLSPDSGIGAGGLPANFTVKATSQSNNTITGSAPLEFHIPLAAALSMRVQPALQQALAGTAGSATLTLDSLGNVTTPVNLTATTSPGLNVTGIPPMLIMNTGESRSLPLGFTVAPGTPAGTTLAADIRADIGGAFPVVTQFGVTVTSAITHCLVRASMTATRTFRDGLGATLARLTIEVDRLALAPGDLDQKQTVLTLLDNLVLQLNAPFTQALAPVFAAARSALAAAATGAVGGVLNTLDAAFCDLDAALASAWANGYRVRLFPAVTTNLPTLPTKVDVTIYNETPAPRAFNLAVTGVPPGVTPVFNVTRVVVPPNYQTNGFASPLLNLTFTNTAGAAQAFTYEVIATPEDEPGVAKSATGQLTLKSEIVRIVHLDSAPAYGPAGTTIVPTARILNSTNRARTVYVQHTVKNRLGQAVTFPSPYVQLELAIGDNVVNLPLTAINTTGYASGTYTIEVWMIDAFSVPIPGATATGSFFIGAPLAADIAATPPVVPSGNSTVGVALTLAHDLVPQPLITLRSAAPVTGTTTTSFAQSGSLLYVCQHNRVSIFSVGNPDAPALLGTFATGLLASDFANVTCQVSGGNLILGYDLDDPGQTDYRKLVVFDIAGGNATNPVQQNALPLDLGKRFGGPVTFSGTTGFMPTQLYFYNPFSFFIFEQRGNLLQLDFSTLTAPALTGELYHHFPLPSTDTNDPTAGGPNMQFQMALAGTTALLASTTSTTDPAVGVGRVNVVDTTALSTNCPGMVNPCITGTVDVPQARLLYGIARQGNAMVTVGDTQGFYDGRSGFVGNLVVTAWDIATPAAPAIKSTLVTPLVHKETFACNPALHAANSGLVALTNNYYAVSAFNPGSCQWVLALIDANDPLNLRVIPYDTGSPLKDVILDGALLYALTETSVLVYDYATIAGPALTAKVDVPTGSGVTLVPGSFNVAPDSIANFAGHDTYTWIQPTVSPLTWQANIAAMQPGSSRDVATGGRIEFTVPDIGSGTLLLGAAAVTASQIVSLAPATQLVLIGAPATVSVTLLNPTANPVTYALAVDGIPASWVKTLAPSVNVPANGQATTPLVLQSTVADGFGAFDFRVLATAGAVSGNATANFVNYNNPDYGGNQSPLVGSSTLVAAPNPAAGARNATTLINMRVTNTGNVAEQYDFFATVVPGGWDVTFDRNSFVVAPGAGADVIARVFVPAAQAPGSFDVTLQHNASFGFRASATIPVNVAGAGVQVGLTPGAGTPATPFSAIVTNRGTATDTFDLVALGSLGLAATLGNDVLTLPPGGSQAVGVALSGIGTFAVPGVSSFEVQAVSRASSAARARAVATVTVPVIKGVRASGEPQARIVPAGASVQQVYVLVRNTGNVEDQYAVAITGKTGPVTVDLTTPQGTVAQLVSPLLLPGFGAAAVPLTANISASGAATVTVRATSLSDGSVQSSTTITFAQSAPPLVITTPTPLPRGTLGIDYPPLTFQASGGGLPYGNWAIIAGALPAGLALDAATGVLSGTGTGAPGTSSFTVGMTDAFAAAATKAYTLDMDALACLAPAPDVVSWWPGDGNGSDIRGGNNGTLAGDATTVPGKVGQAFSFAGAGEILVADANNLDLATAVTMQAWINPATCPHGYCAIVAKSDMLNGGRAYGMWLTGPGAAFPTQPGALHVEASGNGNAYAFTAGGAIPNNVWTHVAGVITAGGEIRIYINGQLQPVTSAGTPTLLANTAALRVGNSDPGLNANYTGLIDDVQIHGRALGADEIQAIHAADSHGQCKAIIDVDADGQTDALSDGLMILRYLFLLNGSAITNAAISPGAARNSTPGIEAYLGQIRGALDVDGNGESDALTDGLMIIRYLFGLRGAPLILNAVAPGAPRDNAPDIETYIESLR
ncbi:MAG: putative Ig domain-containing protein [Betaproteobacteria bacterium]|nr:putative Ig domain-containing protein [Betaproteobacteria bacterium]